MTALSSYSTGTVSVSADGTAVTGTGMLWLTSGNAKPGDLFQSGHFCVFVTDVVDDTNLDITPWPGSTLSGAAYSIWKVSQQRIVGASAAADVDKLVAALNTSGYFVFVDIDETVPDPSLGDDGQFALQPSTGKMWSKSAGVWSFLGIYRGFNITGDYDNGTTYAYGDVQATAGSSYVYINSTPSAGHTAPNATYWQLLAAKGETGTTGSTGATGAGYGGTSTTSLSIGTGSKAFTTQSGFAYQNGARVRATATAGATGWVEGVATYSGTTLTITSDKTNGSGTGTAWNLNVAGEPGGVTGPGSATDNALARFDATTGSLIQNSEVTLGDSDGKLSRAAGISVQGTNTNDSAASGYVGEFVSSSIAVGSPVSLTTATGANVTSISLTAGDWDVSASVTFNGGTSTTVTSLRGGISTTSATLTLGPDIGAEGYSAAAIFSQDARSIAVPQRRISLSTTTTVYLVAQASFSVSTANVFGKIEARRVR